MRNLADKGRQERTPNAERRWPVLAGGRPQAGAVASILIDGRRVTAGREDLLGGLVTALCEARADWCLTVALDKANAWSISLESLVTPFYVPHGAELLWPYLGRGFDLFISPDAVLPLLPMPCPMVHVVHDVPPPAGLGRFRLRRALAAAWLTWFASPDVKQACEAWLGQSLPGGRVPWDDAWPMSGDWAAHIADIEDVLARCDGYVPQAVGPGE